MNFFALSPQAAYALLATVALLIVLIYRLKPRPQRIIVASNLIWRGLRASQRPALDRWHWWLSLVLALITGISIALALAGPQTPAFGGVARRVVIVMDNSPSLAASGLDGTSRWVHAVERARRIISGAAVASEVMVLDTMGRTDTPEWVGRETALAQLRKLSLGTSGVPRMPLFPAGEQIDAYLVTDGVAPLDVLADTAVESVFAPADNVAITAFDAKASPTDPTNYRALVQVFNASVRPRQSLVALSGENGFAIQRELELAAGETVNLTFDVTDYTAGVLRAEVRTAGDGFDVDDLAYSVVAPHRVKRILLVTAGNRHLESSLAALPGVTLTVLKPKQYLPDGVYDAKVFDRFAPSDRPAQGALLFRPPPVDWLPAFGHTTTRAVVTRWDQSHPLAVNVSWQAVRMQRAALAKTSARDSQMDLVLAADPSEGVLVAAGEEAPRWISLGFALDDSNFAMQPGFPVFVGGALEWLTGGATTLTRGLGYIEIAVADGKVTGTDGRPVAAVSAAGATIFEAARPGLFTVVSKAGATRVAANVIDPLYSDINRSRYAGRGPGLPPGLPRFGFEIWVVLLGLAVALLALEWLAYSRRGTV